MAAFTYENIGILGLTVAVPKRVFKNREDNLFFKEEEVEGIIKKTGIVERRIAPETICSSDLCYEAADSLLKKANINREDIDIVIFVSQTPDYRMPATSIILQDRLGLKESCAAFDVSLGCSGFVYGLNLAYSLASQKGVNKLLLLNGETRSRVYSIKDKKTGLLFGDAGSACLVGKTPFQSKSYFMLSSDGSKSDYIRIPSGGYRNPSSFESLQEREYEDGSIRTLEQAVMDGAAVFEFTITKIPRNIKETLDYAEKRIDDIDYLVLHQANSFINKHIAKKLGASLDKVPFSLDRYGNTSSVSIPLTIVSELAEKVRSKRNKVLLSGFGVGLSWGSAIMDMEHPYIGEIIEV